MAATMAYGLMAILMASTYNLVLAANEDPLQDFCIGNQAVSGTSMNGVTCKDPAQVVASDFLFTKLRKPGVAGRFGSMVTAANVQTFPGLNTQGISLARIDFNKGGINPPHIHPRATEILFLVQGNLSVGFVTTANKLFSATLNQGDVFVFPRGLIHFQQNVGDCNATAIAALNSQLPGTQQVAPAIFGANPPISSDVLQLAFALSAQQVATLQANFTS